MSSTVKLPLLAVALAAMSLLSACSDEAEVAEYLARGDKFYSDSRFDRAEIEYLNVLRLQPTNVHAVARVGSLYFEQGRYGRAMSFLVHARDLNPSDSEIRLKLAQLLLASGNHQAAFREVTAVLAADPDHAEAPIFLAEAAVSNDLIVAARGQLEGLSPDPESRGTILVARGLLAMRENDLPDARRLLDEALRVAPNSASSHAGLGAYHEARGDLATAGEHYARAAELSPPTSRYRLRHARFKMQSGDAAGAQAILDQMLRDAPGFLPALLRSADLAGSAENFDRAGALLKTALELDPSHPEALLLHVRLALARKETETALARINRFLELYPDSPDGQFELARVHVARNDLGAAVSSLNRALAVAPDFPEAVLLLANLNIRQGNRGSAIATLRGLISTHPSIVEAHLLLAEAYRGQGDLKEALAIYQKLEAVAPNNERLVYMQGLVLLQQKQVDAARDAFERVLKRNPSSLMALERMINLDLAAKKTDAARARIDAALLRNPANADLHVLSARVLAAAGEPHLAEASLRKAIALQPDHVTAYAMLAGRYVASGDTAKALESLNAVVQRNPQDIGAWMVSAILHEQRNDVAAARAAYEKILSINPRFSPALNNLAYLFAETFNEPARAFELAKLARDVAPGDPYIADTFGWILYRRGDYGWAQSLLRESSEKLPASADVRYHLGLAEYQMGDAAAATHALEAVLNINPAFEQRNDVLQKLSILKIDPATASAGDRSFLEQHLESNAGDPIALGRLAGILAKGGDHARALALQEQATRSNPRNVRAVLTLARMYSEQGDTTKALEWARKARQLAPDDSDVALMLGRVAYSARDYAWAHALLQEAARRQPQNASVQHDFANAAYSMGRVNEARAALSRVLDLEQGRPAAAIAKERIAMIDAASSFTLEKQWIDRAKRRLTEDKEDVSALMILAAAAREANEVNEQRSILERVLTLAPSFSPAKRQLAILLAANPAEDKRALELGTQAREAFPDDPLLNVALGKITYRLGDPARAVSFLEGVLPRFSSDPLAWYCLGMAQAQLNRTADARNSLNRALGLGLTGEHALLAKERLTQAQ